MPGGAGRKRKAYADAFSMRVGLSAERNALYAKSRGENRVPFGDFSGVVNDSASRVAGSLLRKKFTTWENVVASSGKESARC